MTNAAVLLALRSLSRLMDDSRHKLSAEKLPPQNGRSSSVYFSEGIVSLLGISPPPAVPSLPPPSLSPSFWHCTFQNGQNELASLLALWMTCWKDLPWMDDGGGAAWGGERQGGAAAANGGLGLHAVCGHSGPCHTWQRRGGRVVPPYQHATAAPGSCISHAWPLPLSSLPLLSPGRSSVWGAWAQAEFNRQRDKERGGH